MGSSSSAAGELRERPERHERDLARPARASSTMSCGAAAPARDRRLRQLRVPEPVRPVRLRRDLERPSQRRLAAEATSTSARPASSSTARVFRATSASPRSRMHVTATRSASGERGVQERQRVVDPRVDIEDQRHPAHGQASEAMTARSARPSGSDPAEAIVSWKSRSTSTGTSAGATPVNPRASR